MRDIIDGIVAVAFAATLAMLALRQKKMNVKIDFLDEVIDMVGIEAARGRCRRIGPDDPATIAAMEEASLGSH